MPIRLIHNRSIVKYVLAIVGIIIALYFAWNFYPFGEWAGKQFLGDIPFGPQMLGYICAAILGGLVLLLLFHKEYMKEDVQAYGRAKGDKSFEQALSLFVFFVMGLEFFSTLFRIILLNSQKYNVVLFGVGLVGMALTYVISKVLHAQVNRPASVEAGRIMNDAGNIVLQRAGNDMGKLTSNDLRHVHQGNFNPIDRINEKRMAKQFKRQQEQERKQQEKDRKATEQAQADERNRRVTQRFLDPTPIMDSTSVPNGNGHKPF